MVRGMNESAASLPPFNPERQPAFEVRVRLPARMLLKIDELIGARFVDRAEAIRGLLYDALRWQP
jgi:hypothetical protein